MMKKNKALLLQDLTLIGLSIAIALLLAKDNIFIDILASAQGVKWIGSFTAGMFFTTVFTTAPAIVTLGEIAQSSSLWSTALFGALGATLIDLLIFRIVRDQFSIHLLEVLHENKRKINLKRFLKIKFMKGLGFILGSLVLASPLPDELGISIMGLSQVKPYQFMLFSFLSKFSGIIVIGMVARSLL